MKEIALNLLAQWGLPAVIGLVCFIVAKYFKKEKALSIAKKVFRPLGRKLSKFGNTKLGKKSMNKLEEGPISTILGFIGMCISEFAAGMAEDNIKEKIRSKVDPNIMKAFEEAIEK